MNEVKSLFFEKIKRIDNLLTRMRMKKSEKHKLPISGMKEKISLQIPQTFKG